MSEVRISESSLRRVSAVATVAVVTAVVGGAYLADRAYRRWYKATHLLAPAKVRVKEVRTKYDQRREDAVELVALAAGVYLEIQRESAP